jgi:cytochrome c-type biogenesis protein CcmH/NrfG
MVRATKIEPDNARAWRTLGGIEHEMGNVEATVACYDRQLELAPDDPHAMLDRCTIAMDVADYDGARELLAKVMKTDRWPDAVHCLAILVRLGLMPVIKISSGLLTACF